jgi:hypothetical protein
MQRLARLSNNLPAACLQIHKKQAEQAKLASGTYNPPPVKPDY